MIAFDPNGPLLTFTSAANANAAAVVAVQVISGDGCPDPHVMVTNADATNDAIIGWGQTAGAAALAAGAGAAINCFYLLHNTQVPLCIPSGSFITAILVAGTPAIKVQSGISVK